MNIVDRVKAHGLPLDSIVVIGSGLLDALDLRRSDDIDLVVKESVFQAMRQSGEYSESTRHGEIVLEKDDIEAWQGWGLEDKFSYKALRNGSVMIRGVRFCNPAIIIECKIMRGSEKDLRDIALLEHYMADNPGKCT